MFIANTNRTNEITRALNIAERVADLGWAQDSIIIRTKSTEEDNVLDTVAAMLNPEKMYTINGEKYKAEDIEKRLKAVHTEAADFQIVSGVHRSLAILFVATFYNKKIKANYKEVSNEDADRLHIVLNNNNDLAKGLEEKQRRLNALELYINGKISQECDLIKGYAYKKGQAQNAFNFAKLTKDYGIKQDVILGAGQKQLSALAKQPKAEAIEQVEKEGVPVVVSCLTKKNMEEAMLLVEGVAKEMLQAFLIGDLNLFKKNLVKLA